MKRFRDQPIGNKLILIILVASVFALLVAGIAVVVLDLTTYRPKLLRDLEVQAAILRVNMHARLNFDDPETATQELATLRFRPEYSAACVYDRSGRVFARYLAPRAGDFAFPPPPSAAAERFSGRQLVMVRPIEHQGESLGFLYLRYDLPPLFRRLPQYGLVVWVVVAALLAVSLLVTVTLRRVITRPILELAEAAQTVRDQQSYRVRVTKRGHDEIGVLTDAFNQMLATIGERERALRHANQEQKLLQEQLIQAQKMESIGRLAGGIAHDFNNLLTVIVGSTDLILNRMPADNNLRPLLENVLKATTQATNLTHQLLTFARKQIIEPRTVDLNRLLLEGESMLRSLLGDAVELATIPAGDLWSIRADPNQMMQVFMNIAANARDAMPGGGTLTVRTQNLSLGAADRQARAGIPAGDWVVVTLTDTGVGLGDDIRPHIFEPFFTTKESGKGTGLGLATCYGIVTQSEGHLTVNSEPGEGSTFAVYLPRAETTAADLVHETVHVSLPTGDETVMVVEDNPLVRGTAVEQIRAQGYTVLEAAGGPDAIRLADGWDAPIDLLVTDVVMPQMSGREVARRLQAMRPAIKILYVSGYTSDTVLQRGVLESGIAFLHKPYTSSTLLHKIRSVLDA